MKPGDIQEAPVLLLGGRGFIGAAVSDRLQAMRMPYVVAGRDDRQRLPDLLRQSGTIVHLASSTTPGSSAIHPEREQENLAFTELLVTALSCMPPKHLVYFSSGGTVYGNPSQLPVPETASLDPLSPYGLAKVLQEKQCLSLREQGHAVSVLRPANAYGPRQPGRPGFGLVRTLLQAAKTGVPVEVWGDGEAVRDYVYIDDLVDATMRLLARPERADVYNVGSGVGHSVNAVIRAVEQATRRRIEVRYQPARSADVRSVVLDSTKLMGVFGWQVQVSLEEGIGISV